MRNLLRNEEAFTPYSFSRLPLHSVQGHSNMETCTVCGDQVLLSGWATFAEGFPPLTRIAVVNAAKGEGIGFVEINEERPDVKSVLPFAPLLSGYRFSIPLALCGDDPVNNLLLYGLTSDSSHYMNVMGLGAMLSVSPFHDSKRGLTQDTLPYLFTDKLVWADITATHRCNIDCRYCCLHGKHGDTKDADIATLLHYTDTGDDFAVGYWQMSNLGEITIYPLWMELAKAIRKKTPFTILSNFCKQFSEQELLMLAHAKYLTISLDTTDTTLQKNIRTGADPVRIIKNIADVRATAEKLGLSVPYINLSAVVSRPVLPYLSSLALLAVALNINHVLLQDVSADDAVPGLANDLLLSSEILPQVQSAVSEMLNILKKSGIQYTLMASLRAITPKKESSKEIISEQHAKPIPTTKLCLAPWTRMYVGICGNANPCAHIASIGKISERASLKDVANGPRMQAIRRGLLTGELEKCCADCRFGLPCTPKELIERIEHYHRKTNLDDVTFGLFD